MEKDSSYAILGLLSFHPMSGYEIRKAAEQSIAHFWNCNYGQIYPTLEYLYMKQLVTKEAGFVGKKQKNIYAITEKGIKELQEWLKVPAEEEDKKIPFLLKVFFMAETPDYLSSQVNNFLIDNELKLAKYQKLKESLSNSQDSKLNKRLKYWLMTIDYGIHMSQARIEWARKISS